MSLGTDAGVIVTNVIAQTRNALKAAAKHSSVKSFILMSSSTAALLPEANKTGVIVDQGNEFPLIFKQNTVLILWRYLERLCSEGSLQRHCDRRTAKLSCVRCLEDRGRAYGLEVCSGEPTRLRIQHSTTKHECEYIVPPDKLESLMHIDG